MIKAMFKGEDKDLYVVGFTRDEFKAAAKGNPVLVKMHQFGLKDVALLLSIRDKNSDEDVTSIEQEIMREAHQIPHIISLVFSQLEANHLMRGGCASVTTLRLLKSEILVYGGMNEQEMEQDLREAGLIGNGTQVQHLFGLEETATDESLVHSSSVSGHAEAGSTAS